MWHTMAQEGAYEDGRVGQEDEDEASMFSWRPMEESKGAKG